MTQRDIAHEGRPSITVAARPSGAATAARAVGVVAPAVVLVIGMVAAVNLVIPKLQASSLHPSVSGTAWIIDSYTLVFACLLIPAGALGDRFGRKRGMLIGLLIFAVGSAIAALAPSTTVLMCGRALSGVGAALVLPATLAVTLARLEPADRPRGVALWSGLTGVGGVVGNLGGGLAVDYGGWRALFWAGVPIALAAAALIAARVPVQTPHRDPTDGGGALLLTAGVVALLYGIIEGPVAGWSSARVPGALALAVVLLAGFAWYETRRAHPMLDPRLFRLVGVRTGSLGIFAQFFALFGLFYINAQYLQDVKGYSPLLSAVCILPLAALMPYASARSMRLVTRIGERTTIVAGLVCVAVALALLSFATAATPYPLYGLLLAVVGAGMGLAMPPLSGMIVHALPPSHAGVASGLNSTTRELGSAMGVAVLSTVLTARFASHLPGPLRSLPGPTGQAVRQSVTAALSYASRSANPGVRAHLLGATRDAFTSGTSVGLRVGAGLLLVTTIVVAVQHRSDARRLGSRDLVDRGALGGFVVAVRVGVEPGVFLGLVRDPVRMRGGPVLRLLGVVIVVLGDQHALVRRVLDVAVVLGDLGFLLVIALIVGPVTYLPIHGWLPSRDGRGLLALRAVGSGDDELVLGVDHDGVPVLEPDRALQPYPCPAHEAGNVFPTVEHSGQIPRRVRNLADQDGVPFHRTDLQDTNPALHGRAA
jgi:EmrB/QacA subfamily drug resistance transporter